MRSALDIEGEIIYPYISGQRGTCAICKCEVVARCGEIMSWHWAHLSGRDCDPWAEHLTEWHIKWQDYLRTYRAADIEVPIIRNGAAHRADVVMPDGTIIELQHSAITPEQIREREEFYGPKFAWVFDTRDAYEQDRFQPRKKNGKDTFRWKQPRKSIAFCKRKVFLDLGEGYLFRVAKIYPDAPCGGYGKLHHDGYIEEYIG
jgi:competence CoiA-like predicted nuclease